MKVLEGSPIYSQTRPTDFTIYLSEFLTRYQTYSGASYFGEMRKMLDNANEAGDTETSQNNMKLLLSSIRRRH